MLIRHAPDLTENHVTDEALYRGRRHFMTGAAALSATGLLGFEAEAAVLKTVKSRYNVPEKMNSFEEISTYNNFYEFGTDKDEPAKNAGTLKPRPWTLVVDGLCAKPQRFDIDALMKRFPIEERIYRHRCVEAWSMVVPWNGFPLASLLAAVEPTAAAKYVSFTTLADPAQMPMTRRRDIIDWPYREGLRLDEAMHPLSLLAVGIYGNTLPNQNGAPIRLVTPWKYGFKGAKSIVKISLLASEPQTSWKQINAREYGFYANVNPAVDHPRWSQGSERRIGEFRRRETLPFNGYGADVGRLYAGMDLKRFY